MPRKPIPKPAAGLVPVHLRIPADAHAWLVDHAARAQLTAADVARIMIADLRASGWTPAEAIARLAAAKRASK